MHRRFISQRREGSHAAAMVQNEMDPFNGILKLVGIQIAQVSFRR